MYKRWIALVVVLVVIGLALPLGNTSRAQGPGGKFDRSRLKGPRPTVDPALFDGNSALPTGVRGGPLSQRSGPVKVVVELEDAPTAEVFATERERGTAPQATVNAQAQLARIERAQQQLLGSLRPLNATVLYRTQRVYNGIALQVDADQLDRIAGLPGVKAIHPLVTHYRDNSTSVPFIGAPRLWSSAGLGLTGKGLKIAVIDTGIDYLHTGFGGSGTEADYDRNNTRVITDSVGFPSAKVVAGTDLVGDNYNASAASSSNPNDTAVPAPDPDPMDCNGHGSHVAGTAAGFGVQADGTTYRGPYNTQTPFSSLKIGPGVAPEAQLIAVRVFGCEGSTDVTVQGIEYAVDPNGDGDFTDGANVINMSLGSSFGSAEDSTAVASDNAVKAGVIVVASAGNSGDTYYITGSPATSNRTISVASSVDNGIVFNAIRVNSPASIKGDYEAAPAAFGPKLTAEGVTGDVVYAQPANACGPLTNAAAVAGKIALVDRGSCEFSDKVFYAQEAGAIAVIIVNNVPGPPSTPGAGARASQVKIPSVMISQADGARIKAALAAGQTVNVTLSSSIVIPRPDLADTLSSFSSRGPRRDNAALKPDIAAPGQSISSVEALSGNDALEISGTSMAAPHVAGAMALMRQLHPTWTVEELKALVMNTANHDIRSAPASDSPIYGPGRVGAGRIDLPQAAAAEVIAYNAGTALPGLVSVSFGAQEIVTSTTIVREVRVVNKGGEAATYDLEYVPVVDMPGVTYSFPDGPSVNIRANGSAIVRVQMDADPAAMQHTRDVTVSSAQTLPRHWLSEEAGYLKMTASGGTRVRCELRGLVCPDLRLPLHAVPRPASDMRADAPRLDFSRTVSGTIELTGKGLETGTNPPLDEISLVTALELAASDGLDPFPEAEPPVTPTTTLRQLPNQEPPPVDLSDNADIQHIGVTSDIRAAGTITDTVLYFGVATHGPWATPTEVEFDIYFDTDRDGQDDYVLFNFNLGAALAGFDPSFSTDVFVSILCGLGTGGRCLIEDFLNGVPASVLDTVPFNNSVMVLPVYASDLGLKNGASTFNYRVSSFSLDADFRLTDRVVGLSYDAANPGIDFTGGFAGIPMYADLPGETIPFVVDRAAFARANSRGALLLHHHNPRGKHAEVVGAVPVRVFIPLVRR